MGIAILACIALLLVVKYQIEVKISQPDGCGKRGDLAQKLSKRDTLPGILVSAILL